MHIHLFITNCWHGQQHAGQSDNKIKYILDKNVYFVPECVVPKKLNDQYLLYINKNSFAVIT